jgi:beta-xylosidase
MCASLTRRVLALARCGAFAFPMVLTAAVAPSPSHTPWIPDQGDGTFKNPVLHADYSDPDAIRVGQDFWLVSSSFSHLPGLPILHSRDLVNWTLVNHALPSLVPADHFSVPRPGQGVWAPSIRHHAGKFWIYYPDPDFGIYLTTATDPRGKWSPPVLVKAGKGLIDPCPLWDDDGQLYLVHGWAKSRAGISNLLTLLKLDADGTKPLDEGKIIIDANQMPGWRTLEGPKFYKRDGYYFIFAPAGGVAEGYQAVFRSKNISGPYENRIVLEQGKTIVNGPHQGAWVTTPSGENWFLHFQDKGAYGRVVHLQPMAWRSDGWPAMGTAVANGAEKGEPVLVHQKPAGVAPAPDSIPSQPATSDEFETRSLGLQWQWQANFRPDWISLNAQPGYARLTSVAAPADNSLWLAPNLLMQKFPAPSFTATTRLKFSPESEGESAGLMVFGYDYGWLGLRRTANGLRLVSVFNKAADKQGVEKEIATAESAAEVFLRVTVTPDAHCQFSYSEDGATFTPLGAPFKASVSRWVGAKVGIFSSAPPTAKKAGFADFEWFRVTP